MRKHRRTPEIGLLILILLITVKGASQVPADSDDQVGVATALLKQQRWDDVVRIAESSPQRSAQLDYCYGMALAKLHRWEEAAPVFEAGAAKAPADKRFPIELAGIAFQRKRYGEAVAHLRKALRLDPRDSYANEFLGTVYLLEENLPAALKYWNRAEKPVLASLTIEPQPRADPALLDRAFAFPRVGVLHAADFQLTTRRLDLLQIFPSYRFDLLPREDGRFDLLLRASERNGWGDTKLQGLLMLFRNLPFQTVNPEFFNLRRGAANVASVIRWDSKKQRVFSSFAAPLHRDPKWRYRLYADWRKERWGVTAADANMVADTTGDLTVRKAEAGLEIESIVSPRWSWVTGVSVSQRTFEDAGAELPPALGQFLRDGTELKYSARLDAKLADIPERRFAATASAGVEVGRFWGPTDGFFTRSTAALRATWVPVGRGDDYQTSAQLRWGTTIGQVPFDELFMLGMERDNNLWMHAHMGTRNGVKGSAPMGREYVLLNWELDKNLHKSALFNVSVGPLLDTGRFLDGLEGLGAREWLCDIGLQAKVRLLGGITVAFSYARDVRRGRNAVYATGLQ